MPTTTRPSRSPHSVKKTKVYPDGQLLRQGAVKPVRQFSYVTSKPANKFAFKSYGRIPHSRFTVMEQNKSNSFRLTHPPTPLPSWHLVCHSGLCSMRHLYMAERCAVNRGPRDRSICRHLLAGGRPCPLYANGFPVPTPSMQLWSYARNANT